MDGFDFYEKEQTQHVLGPGWMKIGRELGVLLASNADLNEPLGRVGFVGGGVLAANT